MKKIIYVLFLFMIFGYTVNVKGETNTQRDSTTDTLKKQIDLIYLINPPKRFKIEDLVVFVKGIPSINFKLFKLLDINKNVVIKYAQFEIYGAAGHFKNGNFEYILTVSVDTRYTDNNIMAIQLEEFLYVPPFNIISVCAYDAAYLEGKRGKWLFYIKKKNEAVLKGKCQRQIVNYLINLAQIESAKIMI